MIMSDGELYRMQNDAIRQAQETAKQSPDYNKPKKQKDAYPLSSDKFIILAILFLLMTDDCRDGTLLIALAILAVI